MLVFCGADLAGVPLAWTLGFGALASVIESGFDPGMLQTRMMNAVNAFPLMSIPFFVLASELMMGAGMMERLIDRANAAIGRVRGGLAHVTV
jgi:TRAP-type mannitol/chloroaromatic compound transport system permease large subunit